MDHVYDNCKHGLVENIRFLYRMMVDLRARGLKVFAVGKAYDDDLYAWLYEGSGSELEYDGLKVVVFKAPRQLRASRSSAVGFRQSALA